MARFEREPWWGILRCYLQCCMGKLVGIRMSFDSDWMDWLDGWRQILIPID